jgi:hypothetical protein
LSSSGGQRCLSVTDPISGVSFSGEQKQGTLCNVNALVNASSGAVTLQQVLNCADTGTIPSLGQVRQCLRKNGVMSMEPAWFKAVKSQGPVHCLDVFANAVQRGAMDGRRLAVKCADAHWGSILVKSATEAVFIDTDPSNPDPVPFTKASLLKLGYVGLVDVLELVLTKKLGKRKLAELQSATRKKRKKSSDSGRPSKKSKC